LVDWYEPGKHITVNFVLILGVRCVSGVELKDWKAKDDECDKCDGAAGEFTIEGTCVSKAWSCRGVKKTMMTKDCVKYCGDSSAGKNIASYVGLL